MARDNQGNDLGAIDVQLTGFAAINFNATEPPTLAQLAGNTIPAGYEYLGLFLEDGGYAEESEAGDLTYFFQQGYTIRTGDQSISGKLTPAEDNDTVWKLTGITNNVREKICYEGSFGLIIATQFKNGNIVARGGMAHVTEVAPSAESRGEINSIEITFEWEYDTVIDGYYQIIRGGAALTRLAPTLDTENWQPTGGTPNGSEVIDGTVILPDTASKTVSTMAVQVSQVTAGEKIFYELKVRKTSNDVVGNFAFGIRKCTADGTSQGDVLILTKTPDTIGTDFETLTGAYTIPEGVEYMKVFLTKRMNAEGSDGAYEIRDLSVTSQIKQ